VTFFEQSAEMADPELADQLRQRAIEEGTAPPPPDDEPNAEFRRFENGFVVFRRADGTEFAISRSAYGDR
jgi:hypothetical protein